MRLTNASFRDHYFETEGRHFTYVTVHSPTLPSLYLRHSSFSNPSVASPRSQLILQPFFRISYDTGSSLTSPGEPPMDCEYVDHCIYSLHGPSWLVMGILGFQFGDIYFSMKLFEVGLFVHKHNSKFHILDKCRENVGPIHPQWLVIHSAALFFIGGLVDLRTRVDTKERKTISTPPTPGPSSPYPSALPTSG